ncbi:MAG TPA: hypothetical protein VKA46_15790 [Gemmataceae bacterium]|nr:hypothetical protein [Gemmataceae bacterium]
MNGLRVVALECVSQSDPCCRCRAEGCEWDRVNGLPCCPDCQEALAQGHAEPLILRTERRPCVLCAHVGSVRFLTFPLGQRKPVEMDLCAAHFRALLSRRLDPASFAQLRRQLDALGLSPHGIFLLHEAFYDDDGRALQPAVDVE